MQFWECLDQEFAFVWTLKCPKQTCKLWMCVILKAAADGPSVWMTDGAARLLLFEIQSEISVAVSEKVKPNTHQSCLFSQRAVCSELRRPPWELTARGIRPPVSAQVRHRAFTSPHTGFLFAGQIKPASHLTLTNSECCPGGILQLPAKCGQCSGCSWKADDLAAWELCVYSFWAKKKKKKKRKNKKKKKAMGFFIFTPVNVRVSSLLLYTASDPSSWHTIHM